MGCVASIPRKIVPGDNSPISDTNGRILTQISAAEAKKGNKKGSTTIDPRFHAPLTPKERFSIGKSWKAISRNMVQTGVSLFLLLFRTHPDALALFEQFTDIDVNSLESSVSLENHALLVMNTLDEAITNMDDPDFLVNMLLSTGRTHRRFARFDFSIFWIIETPFIMAVKGTLGDGRYTDNIARIYKITIKYILTLLEIGFLYDNPVLEAPDELTEKISQIKESIT